MSSTGPRQLLNNLRSDALALTTQIVRATYREVWREFYKWEQEDSRRALASLPAQRASERVGRAAPSHLRVPSANPADWERAAARPDVGGVSAVADASFTLEVHSFGADGAPTVETLVPTVYQVTDALGACPPYESCAPIDVNIFHGDDPEEMAFVPMADDDTFPRGAFLEQHESLAWQAPRFDPNQNAIILETAYRLHYERGISLAHVDETGVLPCMLTDPQGVLAMAAHRDILDWPGSSHKSYPPIWRVVVPHAPDTLRASLENHLKLFCPNLSCVKALCSLHNYEPPAVLSPKHEALAGQDTTYEVPIDACGEDCYLERLDTDAIPPWSDADIDDLRVILQVDPHSIPCDLAYLCRKPCYEVRTERFVNLRRIWNSVRFRHSLLYLAKISANSADHNHTSFTPNAPCSHPGPCNEASKCACYLNKAHCERNCRCSLDCVRRWRGCRCTRSKNNKKACLEKCPCRIANRECDPELCLSCEAQYFGSQLCRNSQVHKARRKAIEVKSSANGLGAFLLEGAEKGDLVIEYVGELIYEPTFDARGFFDRCLLTFEMHSILSTHRGRSYVYGLDHELNVDSTFAGNESRFINHAPGKKANCAVSIKLVNGDHRIGVYAKKRILAGAELFLDYGSEFFDKV
ncbi:SET domain-containing protein [Obba rivulosa]|uniref:SET domain-containing protein n=1 Tax=Obba rivulosa TaxID=1052685 RepID=A0A8E2DGX4_9APHY|nr:SET domain-containing protein [Obba rivulosa]